MGKVPLRLEEEYANERTGLPFAGHYELESTRRGAELMVRKVKVSGRVVAGLVGGSCDWGRAFASCSCWGCECHLRRQGPAHRISSLEFGRKMIINRAHGILLGIFKNRVPIIQRCVKFGRGCTGLEALWQARISIQRGKKNPGMTS